MKSTGIIRRIDPLGRITLPKELRRSFDLNVKDGIEIFIQDEMMILKKFQTTCVFCDSPEDVLVYKDKAVCLNCMKELRGDSDED